MNMSGPELVMAAARPAGLPDLDDTADTELLRDRLATAGDVVLTPVEEDAYRRTVSGLPSTRSPDSSTTAVADHPAPPGRGPAPEELEG
ncbi:hypothetical protein [Nonomuraea sp. NPDC049625]|uniref:hypothetical protein n=1 Tax=Nonomuraea sp. NPDC049625 TaxID=3155775 RepID=UPI003422A9FC